MSLNLCICVLAIKRTAIRMHVRYHGRVDSINEHCSQRLTKSLQADAFTAVFESSKSKGSPSAHSTQLTKPQVQQILAHYIPPKVFPAQRYTSLYQSELAFPRTTDILPQTQTSAKDQRHRRHNLLRINMRKRANWDDIYEARQNDRLEDKLLVVQHVRKIITRVVAIAGVLFVYLCAARASKVFCAMSRVDCNMIALSVLYELVFLSIGVALRITELRLSINQCVLIGALTTCLLAWTPVLLVLMFDLRQR